MRAVDRVLALLLGLAGLVAGILVLVEAVGAALGRDHVLVPWRSTVDQLHQQTWAAGVVLGVCIGLVVLGLVLLVAELKPRRPALLVMNSESDDLTAAVPRSSVARTLEEGVHEVPGVDRASARVRGRRARVEAHTSLHDAQELTEQVTTTAQQQLASLDLTSAPRLSVKVRTEAAR